MANNVYGDKKGRYEIENVTIRTVDQAVSDYFCDSLNLSVVSGENSRNKVPIIFAGSERWKAIRQGDGIRDDNGTLILPLVSIRRTDIDRQKGFGGMASEQPYIVVSRKKNNKTAKYQMLSQQRNNNGYPQQAELSDAYDYLTLPFPDFCNILYEITIWAQYQNQMNEILEQIVYGYDYNDSFVMPVGYKKGPHETYYFVGFANGNFTSQSNTEEMTDSERIIRYSYAIKVPVYLLLSPDSEVLAYAKDKGNKSTDTGNYIVYKLEGAASVQIKEQDIDLSDLTKLTS